MKKSLPEILKIGDVILFQSGSIVERFQRKAKFSKEASKYTHVAGSLGGYRIIEARDFLHKSGAQDIRYYVDKGVKFIVLRYFDVKDKQRYKLGINWALYANLKYKMIELVGMELKRILKTSSNWFGRRNGVFCSELITRGFQDTDVKLFRKSADLIYPADYFYAYMTKKFKKVYSSPPQQSKQHTNIIT